MTIVLRISWKAEGNWIGGVLVAGAVVASRQPLAIVVDAVLYLDVPVRQVLKGSGGTWLILLGLAFLAVGVG